MWYQNLTYIHAVPILIEMALRIRWSLTKDVWTTSGVDVSHDFLGRLLQKPRLTLLLEHSIWKKKEPWINNFSSIISYLFHCNTDVTSLRSGTAIKGTLLYVSDYITKMTLKTHVAFESICSVFQKNSEMLGGCETQHVKARKLMTKMVNTMSVKLELGSPMICLYLLGNPDHYTSHQFVPFYWLSFVQEVRKVWDEDLTDEP